MKRAIAAFLILCVAAVSAAAVDTSSVPDRIESIRPGEWVILQDTSGESKDTNKITVMDRKGDVVSLRREHYDENGTLVEVKDSEMNLSKYAQYAKNIKGKAVEVTDEFILIDDQGHEVVGMLWEDQDKNTGEKHQYKVLVSPNLPISGVARFWTSNPNAPTADVIAYGFEAN